MSLYGVQQRTETSRAYSSRRSEDYDNVRPEAAAGELARLVDGPRQPTTLSGPVKSITMRVIKKTTTLQRGQQRTRMESSVETLDGHVFVPMAPQQPQVRSYGGSDGRLPQVTSGQLQWHRSGHTAGLTAGYHRSAE